MNKLKPIQFKKDLFRCYLCGKFYHTINGYNKDLNKHLFDGSYEKAMIAETVENRKYIYNYRRMNSRFIPNDVPQSEKLINWKGFIINKLVSEHIEVKI